MINVRCACGLCAEWALVELQGEVEVETEELLNSLDVGRLCKAAAVRLPPIRELSGAHLGCRAP